ATSPFLSSTDDSSNSDIPDTPPSPTHGITFTETTLSTQKSHAASGALRRRVMFLHQDILSLMVDVDYSSSDHFTSDDSSRDSSSSSSSETSSDSSSADLSDSSSNHSSPALPSGTRSSHRLCSLVSSIPHSSNVVTERPSHDSSSASPSRKRSSPPTTSVPVSSSVPGALSPARADLLPSPKRIRSLNDVMDLEDCSAESSELSRSRGTDLEMDVDVERSDEPHSEPEIDPVEAVIEACLDFADIIRGSGVDVKVEAMIVARDEVETSAKGTVMVSDDGDTHPVVPDDIPEPAQEGAVEGTYETLGDLVQRFYDHTVEILVHRVQVIESIQRDQGHRIVALSQQGTVMSERISELEQDNTRLRGMLDVASQRVTRFQRMELREALRLPTMPNTRSGATMTRKGINDLIAHQVTEVLEARDAARNLKPLVEAGNGVDGNRNGGVNRNGNGGGNDNGNGGGNGYGNHDGNFRGFMHVARECTYQDFLKCQPLNFNGTEGVFGLTRWFEKLETVFHISNCLEKYQVKYVTCTLLNSDLTWWNSHKRTIWIEAAYAMRWIKLIKLMTETSNAIRIANNLMDQKLKGYARSAENKRRLENNPRDNRGQQPAFKRQNVRGQNVARAYTAGNNEKKGYVGSLPYCNKCKLHHEGLCTMRYGNCNRAGHMARDCTVTLALNTQRALVGNQPGIVCYECGRPGHYRKDCPKLRNQNRGNKTGNKNGNKTRNQTGGNEATARAYAIGGGGATPIPISALLDVAPSTLDTSYAVELVDGRISETNVVLRGCTLGLLGHTFDIDLMPVELGSFDVIIGMDWLAKYHALIVYDEKVVCIPYGNEMLIIQGDNCDSGITSKKAEDKLEERRLKDVPIVREFPE
ncbi:putative reverse transcriptase domain-containing protein, partial [Tanacetum coccineum]